MLARATLPGSAWDPARAACSSCPLTLAQIRGDIVARSVAVAYLVLAIIVFGLNLLPAFGPPTWAVLVSFRLQSNLAPVPLVLIGAVAAAGGRLALGYGSRAFRGRLSKERIESFAAVRDAIGGNHRRAVAGLALFAIAPVPSAQLFVAAGLLDEPLVPLTLAFFAGRVVGYALYVAAASAAKESLGTIFKESLTSPLGIALQLLMLAGLVALSRSTGPGSSGGDAPSIYRPATGSAANRAARAPAARRGWAATDRAATRGAAHASASRPI